METVNNLTVYDYDIIIQAGQSNALGLGIGEVKKPYLPNENIIYLYDKRNIETTEKGLLVGGDESFPYVIEIAKERNNASRRRALKENGVESKFVHWDRLGPRR